MIKMDFNTKDEGEEELFLQDAQQGLGRWSRLENRFQDMEAQRSLSLLLFLFSFWINRRSTEKTKKQTNGIMWNRNVSKQ